MKQTSILGIGNILLQDEGFGVRVIETLQSRYRFPDYIEVLDGGTLGMDLLKFLMGKDRLLIVDAIAGGGEPGDYFEFRGDEVKTYFREKVSMHELGIQDVLGVLEVLEKPIKEVVVLGVQPASLEIGLELTPIVAGKIEHTVRGVLNQLKTWQVEVSLL